MDLEKMEGIVAHALKELQKAGQHKVVELEGHQRSFGNVVSVPQFERMLTTTPKRDLDARLARIPACCNGANCCSKKVGLTVDDKQIGWADISPFRVWMRPEEEASALRGEAVSHLRGRTCIGCYLLALRACSTPVINEQDGETIEMRVPQTTFVPACIALTCEGPAIQDVARGMGLDDLGHEDTPGAQEDIHRILGGGFRDTAFDIRHVMRVRLLGRPSPFAVPHFDPACMRWRVVKHHPDHGLVLQLDCTHMCAGSLLVGDGVPVRDDNTDLLHHVQRSRLVVCGDKPFLTSQRYPGAFSISQARRTAAWRADFGLSTYGIRFECSQCTAAWASPDRAGAPFPSLLNVYYTAFWGVKENHMVWVRGLRETTLATLALMAGRPVTLPKNYKHKLTGLLSWLTGDPKTMSILQDVLFVGGRGRGAEQWAVRSRGCPAGEEALGASAALRAFKRRGQRACMPTALHTLCSQLKSIRMEAVVCACLAYMFSRPDFQASSQELDVIANDIHRSGALYSSVTALELDHAPGSCCETHCICGMTIPTLMREVGCMRWPKTQPLPAHDTTEGARGRDWPIPAEHIPPQYTCLRWVNGKGAAHAKHGPLTVFGGPEQMRMCHTKRLRSVACVPVYICTGCGETSISQAAVLTKTDRRNKVIGYDFRTHCMACRTSRCTTPCFAMPSYGCFMKVSGVWWCACCVCLQPVMAHECYTHWSATHVCARCVVKIGGRPCFKAIVH